MARKGRYSHTLFGEGQLSETDDEKEFLVCLGFASSPVARDYGHFVRCTELV